MIKKILLTIILILIIILSYISFDYFKQKKTSMYNIEEKKEKDDSNKNDLTGEEIKAVKIDNDTILDIYLSSISSYDIKNDMNYGNLNCKAEFEDKGFINYTMKEKIIYLLNKGFINYMNIDDYKNDDLIIDKEHFATFEEIISKALYVYSYVITKEELIEYFSIDNDSNYVYIKELDGIARRDNNCSNIDIIDKVVGYKDDNNNKIVEVRRAYYEGGTVRSNDILYENVDIQDFKFTKNNYKSFDLYKYTFAKNNDGYYYLYDISPENK